MADDSREFTAIVEQSEGIYTALVNGDMTLEIVFTSEILSRINKELGKGCDTTSRILVVGKKTTFQNLVNGDPVLQSCAKAFTVQTRLQR